MILMHVHLIHPHHRFMILMMSLCSPILSYRFDSDHSFIDDPFDDLETVDLGTTDQPR